MFPNYKLQLTVTGSDVKSEIDLTEDFRNAAMEWRGIHNPEEVCRKCDGSGIRMYPNTGVWRKDPGIVGHGFTQSVCDGCWGSGSTKYPGVNLRELPWDLIREYRKTNNG